MNSLKDALAEALEHPVDERRHHSNKPQKSRRVVVVSKKQDGGVNALLWGALGSFVGAALVYRLGRMLFVGRDGGAA